MRYPTADGNPGLHQGAGLQAHLHGTAEDANSQGQAAAPGAGAASWALATFAVEIAKNKATAAHKQSIFWVIVSSYKMG